MDTTQWSQGITVVKRPMEEGLISSTTNNINTKRPTPQQSQQLVERRTRPLKEQALNCPRCNSTNTKFCYYNNYSLTQPRYFCKTCRRYWTEGGSLRNVPVGGGSRKNKKHSSSSSSSANKIINNLPNSHDPKPYQGQDLNLGFPINNSLPQLIGGSFPNIESITTMNNNNNNNNNNGGVGLSALELLRSTTSTMYHDFSSSSSIIGDGMQLFPFGDLKQVFVKSSANENEQNKWQGGDQAIFWNGGANLGGGSW